MIPLSATEIFTEIFRLHFSLRPCKGLRSPAAAGAAGFWSRHWHQPSGLQKGAPATRSIFLTSLEDISDDLCKCNQIMQMQHWADPDFHLRGGYFFEVMI